MSSSLSREMIEMLEFVLILYCVNLYYYLQASQLIFDYLIIEKKDNISYIGLIGLIIGVIHSMLPMNKLNKKLFPIKPAPPNNITYE